MAKIELPAAKVTQGKLTLYSTAIKVEDLMAPGFYSVETLDPSDDTSYQRLLNEARAKKLADYVVKGQEKQDAFLPTSVFLATDKSVDFDSSANTIEFDTGVVCPLSVVDGQHRLEGLKLAAKKDARVRGFMIPITLADNLPKIHQMCHFYIVNTTQKSVDSAVGQNIVSRLTDAINVKDVPHLPQGIQKIVEKGEVSKALEIVSYLNEKPESPWRGKIKMGHEARSRSVNQGSFVKAIQKHVLTANNPLPELAGPGKEPAIFLNYWRAIADLIDDDEGSATVLFKHIGVVLFCQFSTPFFLQLQASGSDYTVGAIKALLKSCLDNMEGDNKFVGHASWWVKGGKASGMNAGATAKVAHEMARALHRSRGDSEAQV